MLLVLASQALSDWARQFNPFLYQIDLYLGPVWCFVTPKKLLSQLVFLNCNGHLRLTSHVLYTVLTWLRTVHSLLVSHCWHLADITFRKYTFYLSIIVVIPKVRRWLIFPCHRKNMVVFSVPAAGLTAQFTFRQDYRNSTVIGCFK